jgi:hypothetical protein
MIMADRIEAEIRSKSNNATWITILTAVGVAATAFIVAKKVRAGTVKGQIADVFGRCDRAARALDERLGPDLIVA